MCSSDLILQEVEAVCARVLIMSGGRLALDSQLAAVGRSPRLLVTLDRTAGEAQPMLGGLPGVSGVTLLDSDAEQHRFALTVADAGAAAPAVARAVGAHGWDLFALEPERRDLEALFRAVSDSAALSGTAAPKEAAHV